MKTAILSDVHGNLEALQAVEDRLREEAPGRIWFLGDAVGYGSEPNECLDLLKSLCQVILMGNHDAATVGLTSLDELNVFARKGVEYASTVLTPESRAYLSHLPYRESRGGALLVHATPFQPDQWHYLFTPRDAGQNFRCFTERLCFIGHTHLPMIMTLDEEDRIGSQAPDIVALRPTRRYLINVGSVGQPRDGDPRAAFALYDDERREVRLCRVPYDVPAAQAKIRAAGLPEHLAARLSRGR